MNQISFLKLQSSPSARGAWLEGGFLPGPMKTFFPILVFLFTFGNAEAQGDFRIDWQSLDGGGGTSTGGVYTISGTVGQCDAGVMSGGGYSLSGGFWALYAMPTPNPPALGITLTSTNTVLVYWPSPSIGFNLLVNTNLTTTKWFTPAEPVNDNGTNKYIIVNPQSGNRYYRLITQ